MTKSQTTTAQAIRRNFLFLFILFSIFTGLAVISVVGAQLVHQRKAQSVELLGSLDRSFIDDKPDWNQWRRNSPINTEDTYVKVTDEHSNKRFYSPGAKNFIAKKPEQVSERFHIPFAPAVVYAKGEGLLYYRSSHKKFIHSEIWISLSNVVNTILSVISVVIIVLAICLLLGFVWVSYVTKRLTQPLEELQTTAHEQSQSVKNIEALLPVPNHPKEVHDLTISFNELLQSIIDNNHKEKEFISNASHELRTPIAAIRGHISLVKRRGKDHPELIETSLHYIDDESAKMQSLVNELLQLSRADRGEQKLSYFDLVTVVNETAEEEKVVLSQDIKVETPEKAIVYANSTHIAQILSILLENAGKYSPKNSTIICKISSTNNSTTMSVIDHGVGVSDEDKKHIFDRFYRSDRAHSSDTAGNGLGLSIAQQLASLNNVKLSVTDVSPHGSSFNVLFKSVNDQDQASK